MDSVSHDQFFFHNSQANAEKLNSLCEGRLNETNTKLDEMTQLANDLTAQKTKLWSESGK
jgi:myosin protein heavy chain